MKNNFLLYIIFLLLSTYSIKCVNSAITWEPNGGRFGDNLLSYSRAKWLSYQFNIPLLYLPFKYSDQLMLHTQETMYTNQLTQQFTYIKRLPYKKKPILLPNNNTLYISHWNTDISIDWNDQVFLKELKKNIYPLYPLEKVIIPDNCISIALHVRNGGGFVADNDQERERCPLRFVPDEFFIAQVQHIAAIFKKENLYVHIFTDHLEPLKLKQKFETAINNPRITFGCREHKNNHHSNVLEDFFSMMDFDCLIRPGSHYSRFVQRLGNNIMVIYPESVKKDSQGKSIINTITIKTRNHIEERWKTKKITIA